MTKTPKKCYDCGSTIPGHHTKLCDLAPEKAKRDLPAIDGTQWWNGETPVHEPHDGMCDLKDPICRAYVAKRIQNAEV